MATDPSSTPYWHYRSPDEAELVPAVSAETLMAHARVMAAREKESGTPGEAQSYDHIERALKSYGYAVERREIEAFISLPQEGRVALPDGSVIEGLTHAFSPSTDGLEAEVVDVGDGNPGTSRARSARSRSSTAWRRPARPGPRRRRGRSGQIFVNRDHLHNMIVTTIWGTPEPETAWRIPRTPCLSIRRADGERIRQLIREGRGRVRLITRVRTGLVADPAPHRAPGRHRRGPLHHVLGARGRLALRRDGQRHGQRHDARGRPARWRAGGARSGAASAWRSGRGTPTDATPARPGTRTTRGGSSTGAARCT